MRPPLRTYFTFGWFNQGNPSSIEQFHSALKKYNRDAVIAACSAINCLLKTWAVGFMDSPTHDVLVKAAFPDFMAKPMLQARHRSGDGRVVFHRQQTLFVAKMATLHCSTHGANPLAAKYWGGLGDVFLMANDHLYFLLPTPTTPDQEIINVLAQFVPALEISGRHSLRFTVARAHAFLKIARALRGRHNFVDIDNIFQKATGMTVLEFQALCVATISKYTEMNVDQFRTNATAFFVNQDWFKSASVREQQLEQFLSHVSSDADSFQQQYKKKDTGASDFTPFRDKPLLSTMLVSKKFFFPIDAGFLADKIESGIFWTVHNAISKSPTKEHLHQFWADVFEIYLNKLLSDSVDGSKNNFFPSPIYVSDGTQVCDGLMICGTSAILFEYKGVTFRAESKYGGTPQALSQTIDDKLVSPKGVKQLANAIDRLFMRESTDKISGVNVATIRTIFPVLVTRDSIGRTLVLNLYLQRKFQVMVNKRKCRPRVVTPLFCMDAEAIETVSAYLKEARLDDILDAQHRADPNMASTFQAIENSVLNSIGERDNHSINGNFDELFDNGIKTLFPQEKLSSNL
jgi:hypothetical protein